MKYLLFFDTETTGLPLDYSAPLTDSNCWPHVVQLAWMIFADKGEKIREASFVLKPDGYSIPEEASNIHGITNAIAQKIGQMAGYVLGVFQNDLVKYNPILIAHNMEFDENILGAEFIRNRMQNTLPNYLKICTKELTTDYCDLPGGKWPKLDELYKKVFGRMPARSHDALSDVRSTAECFFKLKSIIRFPYLENETKGPSLVLPSSVRKESKGIIKESTGGFNLTYITILLIICAIAFAVLLSVILYKWVPSYH